jgi:N-glycosylase/DNA lyase
MTELPVHLSDLFLNLKEEIHSKLLEFKAVPKEKYFYELVYCLCTPMSKAENALKVQEIFEQRKFLDKPFNPVEILSAPEHYIRFHNQKSNYIQLAHNNFGTIINILESKESPKIMRENLVKSVKGMGFKEASHFLRNIGIFGLAILDRHILRNLVKFNQLPEKFSISSKNNYENIENVFVNLSKSINLEVEEFDILLWANETGYILK